MTKTDTTTAANSLTFGDYKIGFDVEVEDGVELSSRTDGKAYYYVNSTLVEHTGAKTRGVYKVSNLHWIVDTNEGDTDDGKKYVMPADDVIASLAGYYAVTISSNSHVVLLKQNATDSKGAGVENADVTSATAYINITAASGNAALAFTTTNGSGDPDGFTTVPASGTDAGKLLGQFAIRPVDNTGGDNTYYTSEGNRNAQYIQVAWAGANNS